MAGRSLLDLPSEILREVCIQFCLHCSYPLSTAGDFSQYEEDEEREELIKLHNSSLSSLCRTSRQLNAAATPILYHGLFDVKHFAKFMRSLKEHPDLALFIRQITLDEQIELDPRDQGLIDELAGQLGIPIPQALIIPDLNVDIEVIEMYNRHHFFVDICLSLAVNIRELSLNYSVLWDIGVSMVSSSAFPMLKSLRLMAEDGGGKNYLEVVINLFEKAPNLESLEVHRCCSVPHPRDLHLANLRSLSFRGSTLVPGMLRRIANVCKKLESFSFEYHQPGDQLDWVIDGVELTPGEVIEELKPLENTLKNLEIEVYECEFPPEVEAEDMITSLKNFTALETLLVDEHCFSTEMLGDCRSHIFLYQMLPSSIVNLFYVGGPNDLPQLIWELEEMDGLLPQLEHVIVL